MLAWQWRDLAAAEDALSEAFAAALARWPEQGIPDSPEAWLLTVARRELLQTRVTRVSRTIRPCRCCWRWATTPPPRRHSSPTRD
jgi:predicted RNA polymerase sigma factor